MAYSKNHVILEKILKSIEKIERYLHGKSYEEFLADDTLTDALKLHVFLITEQMGFLDNKSKQDYLQIDCPGLKSTGDKLANDANSVDNEMIFYSCAPNFSRLKHQIQEFLNAELN
jgi:uncharacterized protein with HEPN domain